jgi:hypothetical protein
MCSQDSVQALAQLAGEAKTSMLWVLYGLAGLTAGATFAAMELAADAVLLHADQLFLRVNKRKSR